MNSLKIVIVDDSPQVCAALKSELETVSGLEVIKTVTNPLAAAAEIHALKPDILLLDAIMSPIDGDDILESLKGTLPHSVGIIILSPISNDLAIRHYSKLGAHYFIEKPVNMRKLIKVIKLLEEELPGSEPSPQVVTATGAELHKSLAPRITKILLRTGMSPKLKGFCFIRESISYVCVFGNELPSVTKNVYPQIATEYKTEPEKVERAIRTAIEKAFSCEEGGRFYYDTFCSGIRKPEKQNPSNREFIFTIAEYIKNIEPAEMIV